MTDDHHDREDPAVTRALTFAVGAVIVGVAVIVGGIMSVQGASPTDINPIAGGWTAIGAGFIIAVVGGVAAYDHAMILRRTNAHHEMVMHELTRIHEALIPVSDMDRRRNSR